MQYPILIRKTFGVIFFNEQERFFLWSPVLLGIGIFSYFLPNSEPPAFLGSLTLLISCVFLCITRNKYSYRLLSISCVIVSLGFTTIQLRSAYNPTPMLQKEIQDTLLIGTIEDIESMHQKVKITLNRVTLENSQTAPILLKKIRLYHKVSKQHPIPKLYPGMKIRIKTSLHPVSPPLLRNGFNFKRKAFFDGISAHGFTEKGSLKILQDSGHNSYLEKVNKVRRYITTKVQGHLKKSPGAIASALLTGEKSAISKKNREAYANSGIAHLLAISGLHLSLVAGFVFVTLRVFLSFFPVIALKINTKKVVAILAVFATFTYMLISGSAVPSQRSFLMTFIVMLAVLVDRKALSMRSVSLAAFAILIIFPHTLITPSFQLSFAAVVALISFYEFSRPFLRKREESSNRTSKIFLYFVGVLLTSAIATIATTPFTIYHFGQFTLQSLLTNMLSIPLMAFWVMPCGFMSLLLMPFDLHGVFLDIMSIGIECMTYLAHTISKWPGAAIRVPKPEPYIHATIILSGLWLCIWRLKWRLIGAPILLGSFILFFIPPTRHGPDILISPDGKLIGVYLKDRTLLVSAFRHNRFTRDIWESTLGPKKVLLFPYKKSYKDFNCEKAYCRLEGKDHKIAIALFPRAVEKARLDGFQTVDASNIKQHTSSVDFNGLKLNGQMYTLNEKKKLKKSHRPWS